MVTSDPKEMKGASVVQCRRQSVDWWHRLTLYQPGMLRLVQTAADMRCGSSSVAGGILQ